MPRKKTSITAYIVALCIVKLSKLPRWQDYCLPEMVALSTAFTSHARDSIMKHIIYLFPPRFTIWLMDTVFVQGMVQHMLLRKRLIEAELMTSINNGARQVILLGGGFDTLCLRMAKKYPDIIFFEIDLPNTQQTKLEILKNINYPVPGNCIFLNADLSQKKLSELLNEKNNFKKEIPTFVVLEGLLMYLTEPQVKSLFSDLHKLASQVMIIFGAMAASDDDGKLSLRLINSFLGIGKEATKWYCASSDIPDFAGNLGFKLEKWMPYKKLQSFYHNNEEIQYLPEEDENYYLVAKIPQSGTNLSINEIPLITVNQ